MVSTRENATFTRLFRFHIAALDGDRATADAAAVQLEVSAKGDLQYSMHMAQGWTLLEEFELALDWLENAVERGFFAWEYLAKHDRFLAPLRRMDRFEKIVGRAKRLQGEVRELVGG